MQITHRLGGNFTILWAMGMARITGEHADAIGEEAVEQTTAETSPKTENSGPPDDNALWDALKSVYDPEIPVNIVDLGLVYSLQVQPENESGKYDVEILMTLTAPGCGMGPAIAADAMTVRVTYFSSSESASEVLTAVYLCSRLDTRDFPVFS